MHGTQITLGHLNWGDIAAIFGSLASIIAAMKWLLGFYFRQQLKLDKSRKEAFTAQAELLKSQIEGLKSRLVLANNNLSNFMKTADDMLTNYKDGKVAAQNVYDALKGFVIESRKRFSELENIKQEDNKQSDENPKNIGVQVKPEVASPLGKVTVKK